MGVFYETLPPSLAPWLLSQKIFWVATAPLSSRGHVNVSPKAGAPFGLLDTHTHAHASADAGAAIRFFWYLDLTGSGTETMAHLAEPGNGRVTVLFSAFEGGPRILRLWGRGTVLENGTREFGKFVEENCAGGTKKLMPGARGVVLVEVGQVGTSCGFSVPFFEYKGHRETLNEFFAKKARRLEEGGRGEESMDRFWASKNAYSMDGLPGMRRGLEAGKREGIAPMKKMVGPLAPRNGRRLLDLGLPQEQALILVALLNFILGFVVALFGPFVLENLRIGAPAGAKEAAVRLVSFRR